MPVGIPHHINDFNSTTAVSSQAKKQKGDQGDKQTEKKADKHKTNTKTNVIHTLNDICSLKLNNCQIVCVTLLFFFYTPHSGLFQLKKQKVNSSNARKQKKKKKSS